MVFVLAEGRHPTQSNLGLHDKEPSVYRLLLPRHHAKSEQTRMYGGPLEGR